MLFNIYWKDILKPRYGVLVQIEEFPTITDEGCIGVELCPVVSRVPYKRRLSTPYHEFYSKISKKGCMVFCGSKFTLSNIDGIGSLLPHNISRSTYI